MDGTGGPNGTHGPDGSNGPKWVQIYKQHVNMNPNEIKWAKKLPDGPKLIQMGAMGPNGPKCTLTGHMCQNVSTTYNLLPKFAKWVQMCQNPASKPTSQRASKPAILYLLAGKYSMNE